MAEDWKFTSLERRIDELERENRRRSERLFSWLMWAYWTFYLVALTTYVVLSATGTLHHH